MKECADNWGKMTEMNEEGEKRKDRWIERRNDEKKRKKERRKKNEER